MNDLDPKAVARRLTVALSLINLASALLAVALAWLVVPGAHPPTAGRPLLLNGVVLGGYLAVTVLAAWLWAFTRVRETTSWVGAEAQPDSTALRRALLIPLHTSRLVAWQWLGALIVFVAINLERSTRFATAAGITILFTGLAMCAVAYLVAEQLTRPIAARALAAEEPLERTLLGIGPRHVLSWILGTGSAVVGLLVIGIFEIVRTTGDVRGVSVAIIVFCTIAMTGGLVVEVLSARAVTGPLRRLRAAFVRVEQGDLDASVVIDDGTDIGQLQSGFNRMLVGLRERERLRETFNRHVGADVARHALTSAGSDLGGSTQDISALFIDLTDSTGLAIRHPGEEVIALLNRFFGVIVHVVDEHRGSINKFQGDAVLAVFGAPQPASDHAERALRAARGLATALKCEIPEIGFGIGLSCGTAVAGNVGAEHRMEYTVIGDPVNEAARLSDLAKNLPGAIAASEEIVRHAAKHEAAHWCRHCTTVLRGRDQPTNVMISVRSPGP